MSWYTALSRPTSAQSAHSAHEPIVAAALAALSALEIEVQTNGEALRWRPADAVGQELKQTIQANKAAIIAALTGLPEWDDKKAAVTLAECEAAIDAALTSDGLTAGQRAVAEVLRGVVRAHAAQHDPLLFQDRAFLTEQFAGWQKVITAPARRKELCAK
jgi:hypothetical protein